MYKVLFYCTLLLSLPFLEARRSGGGGGGASRGSSGARTNSAGGGGFSPNRGGSPQGGFNPSQGGNNNFGNRPAGGFQQQPNYGNQGGFHGNQGGFQRPQNFNNQGWNRSPGFSQGNGLGSASRGSTFKHALAGAAVGAIGGLLIFEAGKAIINSATTPFHHQGRDYYFNQENYRGPSNTPRCSIPLSQLATNTAPPAAPVATDGNSTAPPAEQVIQTMQFRDGSKPRDVVWSCNIGEICCGSDCCPAPMNAQGSPNSAQGGSHSGGSNAGWIALAIILVLLITCCLGCFCVYKFCRSAFETCLPSSQNNPPPAYDSDKYDYQGQPSQSYPMNPINQYPNQYPAQNQYPPQQYAQSYPNQNQYPSQPGRY